MSMVHVGKSAWYLSFLLAIVQSIKHTETTNHLSGTLSIKVKREQESPSGLLKFALRPWHNRVLLYTRREAIRETCSDCLAPANMCCFTRSLTPSSIKCEIYGNYGESKNKIHSWNTQTLPHTLLIMTQQSLCIHTLHVGFGGRCFWFE